MGANLSFPSTQILLEIFRSLLWVIQGDNTSMQAEISTTFTLQEDKVTMFALHLYSRTSVPEVIDSPVL